MRTISLLQRAKPLTNRVLRATDDRISAVRTNVPPPLPYAAEPLTANEPAEYASGRSPRARGRFRRAVVSHLPPQLE